MWGNATTKNIYSFLNVVLLSSTIFLRNFSFVYPFVFPQIFTFKPFSSSCFLFNFIKRPSLCFFLTFASLQRKTFFLKKPPTNVSFLHFTSNWVQTKHSLECITKSTFYLYIVFLIGLLSSLSLSSF